MELIFVHVGTQCFPPFFPPLDEGGVNLYMSLNTRVFVVVPFSVFVSSVRSPPKRYAKPPAPLDVVAVNVQLARPGIGRPQFASITISVRSASLISSSFKIRSMSFSVSSKRPSRASCRASCACRDLRPYRFGLLRWRDVVGGGDVVFQRAFV